MNLPLPPRLGELLGTEGTNRSLRFYRGYNGYPGDFGRPDAEAKATFLRDFQDRFASAGTDEYERFLGRRIATLERVGATAVELRSTQPLVLGLGLPHPTETALLLDRLTGCPYVPGSSLKGVLRQAGRDAASGELDVEGHPGAADYWRDHMEGVFGPPIGEGATPAAGQVAFFDAFPTSWPELAVDVLTPHHGDYYGDPSKPPGDWEEPVPVSFLVLEVGTAFRFAFAPRRGVDLKEDDVAALRKLLLAALRGYGIGAKAAALGYGSFSPEGPDPQAVTVIRPGTGSAGRRPGSATSPPVKGPKPAKVKGPKPAKVKGGTTWKNQTLELERGKATVWHSKKTRAQCDPTDLPKDLRKRLKKQGSVQADVDVEPGVGQDWRIVAVRPVET